jgi:hypothetical protein
MDLPPPTEEMIDARLAEMERLGHRTYSEIGVPMFLVAEDLTGGAPGPQGDGTGRLLALLLADGAEAMRRRKPELTAADIARLIEHLADRHFLALATPAFSETAELHPEKAP